MMSDIERVTFRAAVYIIIRNESGQILLQKRAGTNFLPGYYDVPSGHVEANESFVAAAARELAEEVCLDVDAADLQLLHVSQHNMDSPYIDVMFEATRWSGEPKIGEPHKCTDVQFFDTDNLPEKCTLAVRLLERQGFALSQQVSYIDMATYEEIMGETFSLAK